MPTATTTETRSEIFRYGLKNATGTVIFWRSEGWGTVLLDGPTKIEYFIYCKDFPLKDQRRVGGGSRVRFDVAACQLDQKKPKPRISSPRLIDPKEVNFNR